MGCPTSRRRCEMWEPLPPLSKTEDSHPTERSEEGSWKGTASAVPLNPPEEAGFSP